jgi:hypothetical protein
LYGRATVFIQSIMVGTEDDGKEYAMCECCYQRYYHDSG